MVRGAPGPADAGTAATGEPAPPAAALPAPPAPPRQGATLAWTSSTYFAEGLPWSVLHQIAGEYLTAIGMRPAQVGYTSFLHATTSLKFVWSPLVDAFGSLRGWMIAMQLAMGAMIAALAVVAHQLATGPDPASADPTVIWLLLAGIGVLSATHDIACDGYYMAALRDGDQARYSGVRVAAFRAAMLVGSSGLVVLGGRVDWRLGFGTAALIMVALALGHLRWLPRVSGDGGPRPGSAAPQASAAPRSAGERGRRVLASYATFVRQPHVTRVLAFLIAYKLADVLMLGMSKVLLDRTLGVPTDVRGLLNVFSIGGSIAGAMLGGAIIARVGLRRALMPITIAMAITEPLYVWMAAAPGTFGVSVPGTATSAADLDLLAVLPAIVGIGTIIVIEQVCGGMAVAAQVVFIMRRADPEHRAAHFAFATAIYSTAQMLVGGSSGWAYEQVGPVPYFTGVSLLTLPAVALAAIVPTHSRSDPDALA